MRVWVLFGFILFFKILKIYTFLRYLLLHLRALNQSTHQFGSFKGFLIILKMEKFPPFFNEA